MNKVYTGKALFIAARISLLHIAILVTVISTSLLFFDDELSGIEKIPLYFVFLIFLWLVFFIVSVSFHQLSLRKPLKSEAFLSKDFRKQGEEIGTYLEGW
jgi:Mn2+/Fe2+ NRAMP family transporter